MSRILIVGAGIVGLSTARAARAKGHDVVLIDRCTIPNPQGASWDSHRMIRHHYGAAAGYTRMVDQAFGAWDRVWADLGEDHYHPSGAIAIGLRDDDYAHRTLGVFRQQGVAHRVIEGEALATFVPQYELPSGAIGVVTDAGGPLFADRIVSGLAAFVRAAGVTVIEECEAAAIDTDRAEVTLDDGVVLAGDAVVVAAGAWVGRLMPEFADIPVMRQALVYVTPPDHFAAAWGNGPALAAYGDHGGYTLPGVRGTDLKFGNGPHRRRADPDIDGFGVADGEAEQVIASFGDILHDIDGYRPVRMAVGYYLMDASRRFRIESRGRAMVITNCDGQMFKFGPLVGERVVAAIEGGIAAGDLAAWAQGN